jgi:hypothetical protein
MKIAILAWGSLIWDKRKLKISGGWNKNGVFLPIEFARISKDGRLTLVITEQYGTDIETYWAISECQKLEKAINNLKVREGTNEVNIGFVDLINKKSNSRLSKRIIDKIYDWGNSNNLDAVIWTDLKSNFQEKEEVKFTIENAIRYLSLLQGDKKEKAFEYIEKAPELTMTKLRKIIKASA